MKVAVIMGSISRLAGGLLAANRRLAQGLQERGDEVSVLSVEDAFTAADKESWESIKTTAFPCLAHSILFILHGYKEACLFLLLTCCWRRNAA